MKRTVSFEHDGTAYTIEVERSGNTLVIEHQDRRYTVTLTGMQRPATPAAAPAPAPTPTAASTPARVAPPVTAGTQEPGTIAAPMTGTVREVRVQIGDAVVEGQVVVVMEAMKMDIDVPTATAGAVTEVAVSPGDSVVEGQLLARVAG